MDDTQTPNDSREFECVHCKAEIVIPANLPPTEGPCPYCGKTIKSPAPKLPEKRPQSSLTVLQPQQEDTAPTIRLTPLPKDQPVSSNKPKVLFNPLPKEERNLFKGTTLRKISDAELADNNPDSAEQPAIKKLIKETPEQASSDPKKDRPKRTAPVKRGDSEKPIATRHIPGSDHLHPSKSDFDDLLLRELKPERKYLLVKLCLLVLLIAAIGTGIHYYYDSLTLKLNPQSELNGEAHPNTQLSEPFIQEGWKKEARQVLGNYLTASTCEGKLPHILNGSSKLGKLREFYHGSLINDLDTPVESFKPSSLSKADHQRGLFRMVHESRNTDAPDSPKAGEPMVIHAYFKHTNQGLKLDWEVFAQTKYRTLRDFIHHPQPGKSGIFRVFITEVTSPAQLKDQTRMYLVSDPAYASDRARASARIGSSTENDLASIHWHGTDSQRPIIRTATLELKWQATKHGPELVVDKLICWEFLGLGGQDKSKPSK